MKLTFGQYQYIEPQPGSEQTRVVQEQHTLSNHKRIKDGLPIKRRAVNEAQLRAAARAQRQTNLVPEVPAPRFSRMMEAQKNRLTAFRANERLGDGLPAMNAKLAAYLAACEVVGRQVSNDELRMFVQASDSIAETQNLLCFGRANVEHDLKQVGNESFYRLSAIKSVEEKFPELAASPAERAAFYAYAGAGNCAEFADVLLHVHAAKLAPGERLHVIGNLEEDHEAVVLVSGDSQVHILLDAWGTAAQSMS